MTLDNFRKAEKYLQALDHLQLNFYLMKEIMIGPYEGLVRIISDRPENGPLVWNVKTSLFGAKPSHRESELAVELFELHINLFVRREADLIAKIKALGVQPEDPKLYSAIVVLDFVSSADMQPF